MAQDEGHTGESVYHRNTTTLPSRRRTQWEEDYANSRMGRAIQNQLDDPTTPSMIGEQERQSVTNTVQDNPMASPLQTPEVRQQFVERASDDLDTTINKIKDATTTDLSSSPLDTTPRQSTPPITTEEATDTINDIAPTTEDKNSLYAAAKRVLGITDGNKKKVLGWLAVSALGSAIAGKDNPLLDTIMKDYEAQRQQEFSKESDKLNHTQNKELAQMQQEFNIELGWVKNEQDFDATMKILNKVREDPDAWAQLQKAARGETTLDTLAKYFIVGTQGLAALRGIVGGM